MVCVRTSSGRAWSFIRQPSSGLEGASVRPETNMWMGKCGSRWDWGGGPDTIPGCCHGEVSSGTQMATWHLLRSSSSRRKAEEVLLFFWVILYHDNPLKIWVNFQRFWANSLVARIVCGSLLSSRAIAGTTSYKYLAGCFIFHDQALVLNWSKRRWHANTILLPLFLHATGVSLRCTLLFSTLWTCFITTKNLTFIQNPPDLSQISLVS